MASNGTSSQIVSGTYLGRKVFRSSRVSDFGGTVGKSSNEYDFRNCSSLFGYAASVHERSGGICELCGAGGGALQFDQWRQLTVEHLIGEGQGGYPKGIAAAVNKYFGNLSKAERDQLTDSLHDANTISACHFCNSATSREVSQFSVEELLQQHCDSPAEALQAFTQYSETVLLTKRSLVRAKLRSISNAFDRLIRPMLEQARHQHP
jgi:hypothetical protein